MIPVTDSARPQLRFNAFMRPTTIHTGAWRYPGAYADANFNLSHLKRLIQKLEYGRFDAFFMADHLAVLNMPVEALRRSHTATSFEPFTLLSALAMVTEHIGLVATGSTTFDQPFHIARRFASLDHISGGRAGWNIVTTSNPDAALNFGMDDHMEHDERYRRAREFYDVVTGLWDSWADDAFVRDQASGLFFDPEKMHVLNHKGPYFSVRGPLTIARPIPRWPVVVQAGADHEQFRRAQDVSIRGLGALGAYIDARDAARACRLAIETHLEGHQSFNVCAPNTLLAEPTRDWIARHFPQYPGSEALAPGDWPGYDSGKANRLLGFQAQYVIA